MFFFSNKNLELIELNFNCYLNIEENYQINIFSVKISNNITNNFLILPVPNIKSINIIENRISMLLSKSLDKNFNKELKFSIINNINELLFMDDDDFQLDISTRNFILQNFDSYKNFGFLLILLNTHINNYYPLGFYHKIYSNIEFIPSFHNIHVNNYNYINNTTIQNKYIKI